jgi:crotonobetainyl-CoA:carnitine CoA-transferase CaiB-like acyl-CoA transferase
LLRRPEWATDSRYTTNAARVKHREELNAMIGEIVATRTKGEWIDALEAAGVPCAPINTLPEAVATDQAAALGIIQRVPGEDYELMALPLSFDGQRPPMRRPPPAVGQHNLEILGDALAKRPDGG